MQIVLIKIIRVGRDSSGLDVWLKYEMDTPIAPFNGLRITDGNLREVIDMVEIHNSCIWCWTCSDRTRLADMSNKREPTPIELITKSYENVGWQSYNSEQDA